MFINIRTVIGLGTQVAGTAKAHHGPFDELGVRKSKARNGQDPSASPEKASDLTEYRWAGMGRISNR